MLDSTSPTPELSIRSPLSLLAIALFLLVSAFGCARSSTADSSETHFLSRCSQDDDCPEALACVCGACSRSCETASNCSELDAKCLPPVGECSAELSCDVECESDDECGGGKCASGRCRHDSSSGIGRVQAGGGDVAQETDDGEGGTISEADAALASNPPIASEYTACESDTDCELRVGTQCCPGCGYQTTRADGDEYYAGGIVALSDPDAFWADVCGDVPISCDPCGPRPIANEVGAACVAGHCSVEYDGSPLTFSADEGDPNPPNEAPLTCEEIFQAAEDLLEPARTCETDDDCVYADIHAPCVVLCGEVVNTSVDQDELEKQASALGELVTEQGCGCTIADCVDPSELELRRVGCDPDTSRCEFR